MPALDFRLRAWASWIPGDAEAVGSVPALLRRRVTPLGKEALKAAWGLPESAQARLVYSSRHGEFSRTLSLLESIVRRAELSPADFTLSVHHALVGLLSIAQGNHRGHTAVAAGSESFCFGLMEAVACLKENPAEPVMLIHCDEPLPGVYAEFNETDANSIVLALLLTATGEGETIAFGNMPASSHETLSESQAQRFLDFLKNDATELRSINAEREWRWTRNAVA